MIDRRLERLRSEREPAWDVALDVHVERQNGLKWCWAAVAKGIVEYYGGPVRRQCEYATEFLRQTATCCGAERTPRCDVDYPVDLVLRRYGMEAPPPLPRPIALETIRRELERDRPIVALMRFAHGFHALAITGVHVERRLIRFSDPDPRSSVAFLDAQAFAGAYRGEGRWTYTLFTRPARPPAERPAVSLLRDRMPYQHDLDRHPKRPAFPMTVASYRVDLPALAGGDGMRTAQLSERPYTLFEDDGRNWSALEQGLAEVRDEVVERLDAGYEVRLVHCFAAHLWALWFVWSGDPAARRREHYLVIPPAPYYLDEGREYTASEIDEAARGPARIALASVPVVEQMWARLEQESGGESADDRAGRE